MSYLSFTSNMLSFIDIYRKISTDKDFAELTKNIQENGYEKFTYKILYNFMRENFDNFLLPFLNNPDNELILQNENDTVSQRFQIYIGKMIYYFLQQLIEMLNVLNIKCEINTIEIIQQVSNVLNYFLNENITKNNIEKNTITGKQIYHLIIDNISLKLVDILNNYTRTWTNDISENETDDIYKTISSLINIINNIINNEPQQLENNINRPPKRPAEDDDNDSKRRR